MKKSKDQNPPNVTRRTFLHAVGASGGSSMVYRAMGALGSVILAARARLQPRACDNETPAARGSGRRRWLRRQGLPGPGVEDHLDDVPVVLVDQVDVVVDQHPARDRGRIAQAVGAPVIQPVAPED